MSKIVVYDVPDLWGARGRPKFRRTFPWPLCDATPGYDSLLLTLSACLISVKKPNLNSSSIYGLRVKSVDSIPPKTLGGTPEPGGSMPNPTILILDDDPDFRVIVQSWREDAEY